MKLIAKDTYLCIIGNYYFHRMTKQISKYLNKVLRKIPLHDCLTQNIDTVTLIICIPNA